jgi:hypothetical protein
VSDEYERTYLSGDEAVHREKRVSRGTFGALAALSAGFGVMTALCLGAFATGDPQGLGGAFIVGGIGAMCAFLSVALSVTRTVVTPRELHFMVGVRTRTVPLSAIGETSTGVIQASTMRADVARDRAEIASIFSAGGGYVRVAWTDEKQQSRVAWIGSEDPTALRAAIDRARRPPPTRVAEPEETSSEHAEQDAARAPARQLEPR